MIFGLFLALNLSDLACAQKYMQNWKQYKLCRVASQTKLTGTSNFQLYSTPQLIWSALFGSHAIRVRSDSIKTAAGNLPGWSYKKQQSLPLINFSEKQYYRNTKLKLWQHKVSNGLVVTLKWRMSCLLQLVGFLLGCSFAFAFVIIDR